jgi:hypothetical protein
MQQGATMAMGPNTNRCPGTAMDQRPAMGMASDPGLTMLTVLRPAMVTASNQRLTVAANQRPGTATDQHLATATSRRLATVTSRRLATVTSPRLATATSPGLAMAMGQCAATVIGTNQRRGAHVPLGRQPIRQMKMPLRCRRTCPHLRLVDDDDGRVRSQVTLGTGLLGRPPLLSRGQAFADHDDVLLLV